MGLSWLESNSTGNPIVWHNGRTAGSASMFAVDRTQGEAVLLLTNRWAEITGAGFALLGHDGAARIPNVDGDTAPWVLAGILLVAIFALVAALGRSRISIVGSALAAAGALTIWVVAAPWSWVPAWVFGMLSGLWVAGVIILALRWLDLPMLPAKRVRLAVIAGALGTAWFAAMLALVTWVAVISMRR